MVNSEGDLEVVPETFDSQVGLNVQFLHTLPCNKKCPTFQEGKDCGASLTLQ